MIVRFFAVLLGFFSHASPTIATDCVRPDFSCADRSAKLIIRTDDVNKGRQFRLRDRSSRECGPFRMSGDRVSLSFKLKSNGNCGSVVKKRDEFSYYGNQVTYLDQSGSTVVLYNVSCVLHNNVGFPSLPYCYRERSVGDFPTMRVRVYRDQELKDNIPLDDIVNVPVGQFLYIHMGTNDLKASGHVFADSCFASYSPSSINRKGIHHLIQDGRPAINDTTVGILNATTELSIVWRFQMFKWSNVSRQRIYIFCQLVYCPERSPEWKVGWKKCMTPVGDWRQRAETGVIDRTTSKNGQNYTLGIGPLLPFKFVFGVDTKRKINTSDVDEALEFARTTKGSHHTIVFITVGVVCGVTFLVFLSALLSLLYRSHRRKREMRRKNKAPEEEERIQTGFAFVLRSSDDVAQGGGDVTTRHRADM